jgi:hypothetical protein
MVVGDISLQKANVDSLRAVGAGDCDSGAQGERMAFNKLFEG